MKIALAQLNPTIGAIEENKEKALKAVEEAKRANADLLLFPELTLIGYPPRDLLENKELIAENMRAAEAVGKASSNLTLVLSVAEPNPNEGEKPLFNVAQVWQNGKLILKYKKRLFPYYDIFDEARHFEGGNETGLFTLGNKKVAVTICEDIWGKKGYEWEYHGKDVTQDLVKEKPDLVINLSASPFQLEKTERRISLLKEIAHELKCPVVYCNQTGANDELLFDGSSLVLNANGEVEVRLPAFEEKTVVHTLGTGTSISPYPKTKEEWLFQSLVCGVSDYFKKTKNTKAVLGLSGGIDSAVVLAIVSAAVGAKNVKAVGLPSRYNASQSLEDAKKEADNLGVEFEMIPIEPIVESFLKQIPLQGLPLENIQPRIRMTLLMAIANKENRILLNTSNKSEIACGYATLYGDSAGALAVLGDVKKNEVYALARWINREREIIPRRVIDRAPSAELKENQTDQDSLPPYDDVDQLVEMHVEKGMTRAAILKAGMNPKSLDTFLRLYQINEYKRRQLPPALRVTGKAFGMGRRIPVVRFTQ